MSENRDFFRIDDQIFLHYSVIETGKDISLESCFSPELLAQTALLNSLDALNDEYEATIRKVQEQYREVGQLFQIINKKLDLMVKNFAHTLPQVAELSKTPVNLSETGLAFISQQVIPEGTDLALILQLDTYFHHLLLLAKVVHCQELPGQGQQIGLNFTQITQHDQQIIAKHVLRKQAIAQRQRRSHPER